MAFAYFPHTEDDIRQMLDRIGVGSLEDLYSDVPKDVIYSAASTCAFATSTFASAVARAA